MSAAFSRASALLSPGSNARPPGRIAQATRRVFIPEIKKCFHLHAEMQKKITSLALSLPAGKAGDALLPVLELPVATQTEPPGKKNSAPGGVSSFCQE